LELQVKIVHKFIRKYFIKSKYSLDSDIYISSFPKSGVTWFSFIIANIMLIESDIRVKATYYNIGQLIPSIGLFRNKINKSVWSNKIDIRFIKTHEIFNEKFFHSICLVRNPVSVMSSYYRYAVDRNIFSGTMEEFIKHDNLGVKAWNTHISSWLIAPLRYRKQFIKFEDLRTNTFNTISDLFNNLGIIISDESIVEAIKRSDISEMKKSETLYSAKDYTRNVSFVKEGDIKANVPEHIKNFILDRTENNRKLLGY
jgi:hypothetical protein